MVYGLSLALVSRRTDPYPARFVTEIAYQVRRSNRARRVRVSVGVEDGVVVVLPRRTSEREAEVAVRELRPWIERRLRRLAHVRAELGHQPGTVPLLGRALELVPEPGRSSVRRHGERLLVPTVDQRAALERWYRRTARLEIAARLDRATAATDRSYRSLVIRGQRTRWASCSASGTMSFNWRLMLAPEPVVDYVVWHEVCHLEVLDHSPRFWALVARRCPDYRRQIRWLGRYGPALVLE